MYMAASHELVSEIRNRGIRVDTSRALIYKLPSTQRPLLVLYSDLSMYYVQI